MSESKIRNLFQKTLAEYSSTKGIRVAYENVQLTPNTNETYLVPHLMPSLADSKTLSGDHKRYMGVYQITVVTPSGQGTFHSDQIVTELRGLFPVYGRFSDATGFTVVVMTPLNVAKGKVQDGGWIVPCYFDYRADTI